MPTPCECLASTPHVDLRKRRAFGNRPRGRHGGGRAGRVATRRESAEIAKALETTDDDEATVRDAVPKLTALLPRLTAATDSANVYIRLATAYGMVNDAARACATLQKGNRLSVTAAQLQLIRQLKELPSLKCVF